MESGGLLRHYGRENRRTISRRLRPPTADRVCKYNFVMSLNLMPARFKEVAEASEVLSDLQRRRV